MAGENSREKVHLLDICKVRENCDPPQILGVMGECCEQKREL
jgi:hypothetical protein